MDFLDPFLEVSNVVSIYHFGGPSNHVNSDQAAPEGAAKSGFTVCDSKTNLYKQHKEIRWTFYKILK